MVAPEPELVLALREGKEPQPKRQPGQELAQNGALRWGQREEPGMDPEQMGEQRQNWEQEGRWVLAAD